MTTPNPLAADAGMDAYTEELWELLEMIDAWVDIAETEGLGEEFAARVQRALFPDQPQEVTP